VTTDELTRIRTDWLPTSATHPLACKGQVLAVRVKVTTLVTGRSYLVPLGRFLTSSWQEEGGLIRVSGVSLTQRLVDDSLTSPMPARSGGTLASELRRLIPASLGLWISPSLVDRVAPKMAWGDSRMDALKEVLDAWPARMREDSEGAIRIYPPLPESSPPVATLHDGTGGTVVSAYTSDTRQGIYNVAIARGQDVTDSGVPAFQEPAEQTTGPYATDTYGRVVRFFSSPLITSKAAAAKSASTMLANSIRPALTVPVSMAPDPRLQIDDSVMVTTEQGTRRRLGYISGIQLPLVADSDMRVDVEVAA